MVTENRSLAREGIQKLVTKYEEVVKLGQTKKYTEEETKKDFILPLFELLGWDVKNRSEVSAEEHIKSSGRVDYGFYLNGRAKFYLEAKPLKANLNDPDYAKQAIRYSWNRGITWAVLTDFEKIKVFNAEAVSKYLSDKLYFEIPYNEFLERFDQLWQLSKESFGEDLIDKEAQRVGKKLQKVSVDDLLYKDLNESRKILTEAFSMWNDELKKNRDLLDEGVQKLLDRLVFMRVAEDRGIEPAMFKELLHLWKSSDKSVPFYKSIVGKFRELDTIYNSNLFSPHVFENWDDYDNASERVIRILYGKEGYYEYDFKFIPSDVLGTVYENYLGYRLSQSKKVVEISKDAKKRKESGIYYTPAYIVDYIVRNSLGPVLEKCHTIADLKKIKVLDPACGSGSFLIKVLELINDKYKSFNNPGNVYTKIQILTENIYGVDLDEKAVELARLNLMINSLDGRTRFPSLGHNIRNGNSLISGTDKELEKQFGKNWREKKPFNWQQEFPEVFAQGGFDVIVGNPPYIRPEKVDQLDRDYYIKSGHFEKFFGRFDIYILFIEKALKILKSKGVLSYIVPSSLFNQNYAKVLREWLLSDFEIEDIEDLSDIKVFDSASVQSAVILVKNNKPDSNHEITIGRPAILGDIISDEAKRHNLQKSFLGTEQFMIRTEINEDSQGVIDKIKANTIEISDICYVAIGIVPHDSKTGASKDRLISLNKTTDAHKRYVEGKDIGRYKIKWRGIYLDYQPEMMHRPKFPQLLENDKLFIRNISTKEGLLAALDKERFYVNDTASLCIPWYLLIDVKERGVKGSEIQIKNSKNYKLSYLLALINSKLLNYYFKKVLSSNLHVYPEAVRSLPIQQIDFKSSIEKNTHDELSDLGNTMTGLNEELKNLTENSDKWTDKKAEIERTDQKIDQEVYKLYGLTPEEIKIVEKD